MSRFEEKLDWNAAGALFLAYRAPVERFLRARLAPSDAEEVLQDVWIKCASLDLSLIADPLAYLYRMADNMARNRHRSAARHAKLKGIWARLAPVTEASSSPCDPESELITREKLLRVEAALATLPPRTANIFRAFRVDGMAQKAIAAEHGISVSAVEKHLQRAYRLIIAVQSRLDADFGPP